MKLVLLSLCALACVALRCHADIVQTQGRASLTIQHPGETPTIALADTITVVLTVEGSKALRVQAPLELPRSAKWQLIDRSKADREPIAADRVRWRIVYRFAPRGPGELSLAFPSVTFRDSDDQDQSVSWDPVVFMVKTQITSLDRAAIRGVPDIENLPAAVAVAPIWPIWLALAGGLSVVAGIAFGWRRWSRRRVTKTPAALALCELDRLITLDLPGRGRGERFLTLLSLVLRRYLEKQFHLPARRQTTREFLQHLDVQRFNADEKQFLTTFLSRCDAVKFARFEVPPQELAQWTQAVQRFLRRPGGEPGQTG